MSEQNLNPAVLLLQFLEDQPNNSCTDNDMERSFDAWLKNKGLRLVKNEVKQDGKIRKERV